MDRLLLASLLCISWATLAFAADPWSYDPDAADGPSKWTGTCASGKEQSPIDIKSANATFDEGLGEFTLKNYDKLEEVNFTASNDGHAMKVAFPAKMYNVSGGGLTGVYTTVQFHLHWGTDKGNGSEHTFDEKQSAAELHFVSYNTKYEGLVEALPHADGLAVLGVMIEVGDKKNEAFSFLDAAKDLTNASSEKVVDAFKFDPVLPTDKTKYFRYSGSLTTPPCSEAVTWTVFKDAVKISQEQMNLMLALKQKNGALIENNFRPVQPLYDRKVTASFQTGDAGATTAPAPETTSPTATATATATAVRMTAGLFFSILFVAFFLH